MDNENLSGNNILEKLMKNQPREDDDLDNTEEDDHLEYVTETYFYVDPNGFCPDIGLTVKKVSPVICLLYQLFSENGKVFAAPYGEALEYYSAKGFELDRMFPVSNCSDRPMSYHAIFKKIQD